MICEVTKGGTNILAAPVMDASRIPRIGRVQPPPFQTYRIVAVNISFDNWMEREFDDGIPRDHKVIINSLARN